MWLDVEGRWTKGERVRLPLDVTHGLLQLSNAPEALAALASKATGALLSSVTSTMASYSPFPLDMFSLG